MTRSKKELLAENEELRRSLGESQELLRAISSGEVDALVISRPEGVQVFTLEGADRAYRVLIEAMNDGAVTITSEGTILFCNRHFAEMVKSPLEKVIGSSLYRFIQQADQAAFNTLQQSLGRDELNIRADDESILPVYISFNSLQLSESQDAFCVIVTDLTEQKRKEEIVAAEKLARSIIEQATEAVVVCDESGKIIRFSHAVSRILGCDPSLQIFENIFDLKLPTGKKLLPVSAALQGEVLLEAEASLKRSDGILFDLLLNAGPLKSADGNIIGCVVTTTDITERKRMENALRVSEARYRDLFNAMSSGAAIYDVLDDGKDFIFSDINPAGEKIDKVNRAEIVGKSLYELFPNVRAMGLDEVFRRVWKTGSPEFFPIAAYADDRIALWLTNYVYRLPSGELVAIWDDITERKKADEALRDSEERYRSLFNSMTEGFALHEIICDEKGEPVDYRFLDTNPAFERLTRLKREDVIGKTLNEVLPGEDPRWIKEYGAVALTGEPKQFENYSPALGRHYEVFSYSPAPRQFAVLLMDITERKQAEELLQEAKDELEVSAEELRGQNDELLRTQSALQKSKEHAQARSEELEKVLDSVPAGIWIAHDPQALHITGNKLSYEWLNIPPYANASKSAPEGKRPETFRVFKDGKELQPVDMPVQRSAMGKEIRDYEFTFVYPDGTERHMLGNAMPLLSDNCKPRGSVSSFIDITERKRAEEALRKSENRFKVLIDNLSSGVALIDENGKFTIYNPAFLQMFGLLKDSFDIKNVNDQNWDDWKVFEGDGTLMHVDEHPVRKAALTGKPVRNKPICVRLPAGGGLVWMLVSAEPILKSDGEIDLLICTYHDITALKQAEEGLKKAYDKMELRVQERTAELSEAKEELECINEELRVEIEDHSRTEEALLAAKDAAEAAGQAKSDFMANMSHEIRTPMNAVIGMTSLLLDDETLNPEQKDFVETIRMSGDALMVIINDILDFSKMQEDKVILENQPFDLGCCVEEALDLVAKKASEKRLNLAYTIDKNVPEVIIGDPNRLRQILSNLLNNAVNFTEHGEIKLSVSGQMLEDCNEILFAVQDTGIGISQDQMDFLFQPFSQINNTTTRDYGGTGLGLVISKKLAELMGGKIWAKSEPGKGSTFNFTIQAETAPGDAKEHLVGFQPQLVGKHVLIVNDNRTNRRILGAYAYSWGMVPLVAAKTKDALEWIRRGDTFDVAILDTDMQDMDGLALANEMRRYNKTLPLVILAPIGQHLPPDHAHLTKPIKPSQLYKVLTNIISMQLAQKSDLAKVVNKEIPTCSLRILIAEDNVSSQKVTKQMLKRLGYRADVAANGIEALQALERQPYDVVLMDLKMPEMDGLEATRIIRQRWPDNGPKIIAVTAYALQGDKEKCIEAGMDDYISKPIKMNELAEVLRRYQSAEKL
ncbi:MAG: PAS domain S-box protein [Methanothrix sp.]|nr:MAG: PAS domain S-box protein [Methanothrix sp.]